MDDYIVGIDLGTTYSCLAYIDASGSVKIEKNSEGDETTPSAIIFDGDNYTVGRTAKRMASLCPEGFVDMMKRDMGTDRVRTINGQDYTPSKLSAIILKSLIDGFNANHECSIKRAVISVPAYFGDAEREATIYAGKIAGLDEVSLIPEPVAASIAYGVLDAKSEAMNILVYDLGGGTFDATILRINGTNYTTLSVDGDKYLGGKDWDSRLIDLIIDKIADDPSNNLSREDLEDDSEVRMSLKMDAETLKKDLTNMPKIRGTLRCGPINVAYTITREEFETITRDLLMTTIEISKNSIERSGLTESDIDLIVLVGGSSRMPQVKTIMEQEFPNIKFKIYNPDLAVAEGAALYSVAKILNDTSEESETKAIKEEYGDVLKQMPSVSVTTVLPKSYGVSAIYLDESRIFNILFRNTAVPIERSDRFYVRYDNQTHILVEIYENESYMPDDGEAEPLFPEDCGEPIGRFEIELPSNTMAGEPVDVTMSITDDKNLFCTVVCRGCTNEFELKYRAMHQTSEDLMRERESLN